MKLIAKKKLIIWLLIFLLFTVIAFLNYARFVTNELAEGKPGKFLFYLIMETTGAYTILFLLPILFWFFRQNLFFSSGDIGIEKESEKGWQ